MCKKTVNVNIEAKSANAKMSSVELNRLIFFIVDYVNQDSLYLNFNRYCRLAQMRTAGVRLVKTETSSLENLSVNVRNISVVLCGHTCKRPKDMKGDYKFPPTDLALNLPRFGMTYDRSKADVLR